MAQDGLKQFFVDAEHVSP